MAVSSETAKGFNASALSAVAFRRYAFTAVAFLSTLYLFMYIFFPTSIATVNGHLVSDASSKGSSSTDLTPKLDSAKVATLIELRPMANLVPLILHFASVLGPTWPIRIFHSTENAAIFKTSHAMKQYVVSGRIVLTEMPAETSFKNHNAVSEFLAADTWFWDQLAPADHVLLFQADSILCSNAPQKVDDYFEYDLIGAPIDAKYGVGYNGGLSLRNRNKVIEVIKKYDWQETKKFEDQWFYIKMNETGARLPKPDIAKTFSIETIYYDKPLGLHQVQRWQKSKLDEVSQWCPEWKLTEAGTLYSPGH
jgi:Protein of unknown function (DUF5672)